MSNVYFCSDLHLNHQWAASVRGFHDPFYHDEALISLWNTRITKRDTVYILGDISMEDVSQYHKLVRLAGNKVLIAGNHDCGSDWIKEASKYFKDIRSCKFYRSKKYGGILLSHMPVHPMELESSFSRAAYNIHGHIHSGYVINDPRYINVCMENIGLVPKTLDELLENTAKT